MERYTTFKIYNLAVISLFTSLIIVGAYVRIPFPVVPLTLQTFFVILSAILLRPESAFISSLLYIFLGLAGLPVFTKGGGISYIFEPTFGYIAGFAISTFVVSHALSKFKSRSIPFLTFSGLFGILIIYLIGMTYMYFIMNFYTQNPIGFFSMFTINFLLTIFGDILKCIACAIIAGKLYLILKNNRFFAKISNIVI